MEASEESAGGLRGGTVHSPEKEGIGEDGYPKNAVRADMYFCCDSRKDLCPYSFHMTAETGDVSFAACFCLYGKRKSAPAGGHVFTPETASEKGKNQAVTFSR